MAKKYYKAPTHQTGTSVTTKTHFGSTSDMIVDHSKYKLAETNASITLQDNDVLCRDDRGFYITSKNRLDSGLADPNRYANEKSRLYCVETSENDSSV